MLCHVLLFMLMNLQNLVWKYVQMARLRAIILTNANNFAIMDSTVLIKYVSVAVLLTFLLIILQESAFLAAPILLSHMLIPPIGLVYSTVQLDCMLISETTLAYQLVLQVFSKNLHFYCALTSALRTISVMMSPKVVFFHAIRLHQDLLLILPRKPVWPLVLLGLIFLDILASVLRNVLLAFLLKISQELA